MLLNFTFSNWKSFAAETTLQLTSSREKQHKRTLAAINGFRSLKACPVASVYGGNASGKTSLFEALSFLKEFVVNGAQVGQTIQVEPFRLDKRAFIKSTVFDITFFVQNTVYRLEIELRQDRVLSERLSMLRDAGKQRMVYQRDEREIICDESFFSTPDRVAFVADGTLENRLFLTNAVMQNVRELEAPYLWFRDSLKTIGVASRFENLSMFYTDKNFLEFASQRMAELDTGIVEIIGEHVDVNSLPVPPMAFQQLQATAASSYGREASAVFTLELPGDYAAEMYFVNVHDGAIDAQRLRTRHRDSDGRLVTFALQMESSGTRRLLDLMPMLFELFGGDLHSTSVYVVDELDRCFHSMLTQRIIELFLETAGAASRRQLLFTTHDLLLMNQDLLRRDEMFIAQRKVDGSSELIRLSEYEGLRNDLDLLKSYLDGRFGGVPMFSSTCLQGRG